MINFKEWILEILDEFMIHYNNMANYHVSKHCRKNERYADYSDFMWMACNHIRRRINNEGIKISNWNDLFDVIDGSYKRFDRLVECERDCGQTALERIHLKWCNSFMILKSRFHTIEKNVTFSHKKHGK